LGVEIVLEIIKFTAPYCSASKPLDLSELTSEGSQPGGAKITEIDVTTDEGAELANRNAVRTLPTLLFYREGIQIGREEKPLSMDEIKGWLRV
jgi:hypothetical protein